MNEAFLMSYTQGIRSNGGREQYVMMTAKEDQYILIPAKRNRRSTAIEIANQFLATGKRISRKTVARRLHQGGLYARRRVVCIQLSRFHRSACL